MQKRPATYELQAFESWEQARRPVGLLDTLEENHGPNVSLGLGVRRQASAPSRRFKTIMSRRLMGSPSTI